MRRRVYPCLRHSLAFSLLLSIWAPITMAQANVQGQWSTLPYFMPINPVHVALLNNGKVLVVAGSGNCPPSQSGCPSGPPYGPSNNSGAVVWDPVAGAITQFSVSWDMFCNGMVMMQDGRVLIDGGTIQYDPFYGQPQVAIFDPATNTFSNAQSMADGRWYPTVTTLGDGRIMAFSGLGETGATNDTVELYTVGAGWSQEYPAGWTPPLYPRMHLLPNGKVFYSGSGTSSALFDPSTTSWTLNVATTNYSGTRTYGSSVLLPLTPANNYDPKIMIMGGNSPATNTTEIIDMGAATPKWVYGLNMSQPRIEMNAVILPDGRVLAVGGSVNDEDTGSLSLKADLFDLSTVNLNSQPPNLGTISSAGANATERLYHSVALLLPDATVWLAGGNPQRGTYNNTMEIYQPPYLFNSAGGLATRPSITSAPSSMTYGNGFTLQTPDAANISSVVLVRNGTVTHAFGMDQRVVDLSFTGGAGSLTVTAPPNGNIAPPGYYMLFILNSSGVPSVAKMVQISPMLSSVSPNHGPTAGGTAVTITGTTFASGATVTIGGTPATNVVVVNSTTITATTPAGNAGAATITVTNPGGQIGSLANGFTYNAAVAISFNQVASATPQSTTATVPLSYPAAQLSGDLNIVVVGWNDTTATVQSVTDSAGNTYSLAIGPTSGTALRQSIYYAPNIVGGANTVTVTFNQPAAYPDVRILEYRGVTTLDAKAGASGNSATTNSGSATTTSANELIFGANMVYTLTAAAGSGFTTRVITSPDGDIAEDKVVTTAGSNSATATLTSSGPWVMQMVTFSAASGPVPTVGNVAPNSGSTSGGTAITITGTNFASGATVTFGGAAATNVMVVNSTTITATTPADGAGAVTVTVTNPGGQSGSLGSAFTYLAPPTVSSVSPNNGPTAGGTAVTITGANFASGATVTFGGAPATNLVVVNSTTITATTPAGGAGAVTVTVTNPGGQSGSLGSAFTYLAPPTVSSVSPNNGPTAGGTAVTITGANFASGATVTFGGAPATNVVVANSTTITATTPAGSAGAVTVTVTVSGQSGSLTSGFTYVVIPTVSSVAPNNGPTAGGTAVTITGANFAAGATVTFGAAAAINVVVVNSTTITATTPSGSAGTVAVTVTVNSQSGSLTNGFTYVVPPTVSSVSPNNGSTLGGTLVTITGTNFVAGATVTFGGTAATNVVIVNSTTITATTPAHAFGAVTVTVTNPGALVGSLANGYTYVVVPTVSSVVPNNGPIAGGTAVTITGTNFVAGATVTFGSNAATNVVVVSGTQITATTPAGSAGAVTVTVTANGQSGSLTNGFTYNAAIAISFGQVAAATPQSSTATVPVTFPGVQTVGDLNIVVVGWNDTTSAVQSVTDSAGNTYSLAIGPTSGTALRQSIYYAPNIVGGANTVTVTFNQPAAYPDVRILEYRGVTTLDAKAGASGNSATTNSGSATTTSANELIFGANMVYTLTAAAGSGFTTRVITSPDGDIAEDKVVTTAGSNSATATLTSSGPWVMQMVTFK